MGAHTLSVSLLHIFRFSHVSSPRAFDHYKTHDREIFLVEELGRRVSFSRLTGNNVPLTKVFLV